MANTQRTRMIGFAVAGLAMGWSGQAIGQDESPASEAPLLSGPAVEAEPGGGQLDVMNLDGTMKRLDAPAAEIAVEMLDLDDATRARVDAVLEERAAAIDSFVQANLDLLTVLPTLRNEENREKRREVFQQVREGLAPELAKGTLAERIAAVLPDEQRASYESALETYRADLLEARLRELDPERAERARTMMQRRGRALGGGAGAGRIGAEFQEVQQIIQIELRRSYERIRAQQQSNIASLVERLDLDPETEERVRSILREAATEAGDPREIDRRKVLREINAVLTPEQRRAFMRSIRERRSHGSGT